MVSSEYYIFNLTEIITGTLGIVGAPIIVIEAAAAGGFTHIETISWFYAVQFFGALFGLIMAFYYRMPIVGAHSITGVAFLVTVTPHFTYSEGKRLMYKISGDQVELVEPDTFAYLKWTEQDIEELVRKNIDMICDEEESMLIVGRQVRNESNGISDLTAIDNNGNLVLIEIKRDRKDILNRKEAFEFQAIRYAASYATIQTPEDLVERIYAPYIGRYREEFSSSSLTNVELAARKLQEFLETNHATQTFNQAQRIILLASDYDEQTLSAVSWLNSNNVDIGCYKLIPYRLEEHLYIRLEKLLPLTKNEDYYIPFSLKSSSQGTSKDTISRRNLPKIKEMLDWGVVKPGDIIMPKDREGEGVLTENGHVEVNGEELSLQKWLKEIYGWSSIQTYAFAIHKDRGISLSQIRKKYMDRNKL